MENKKSQATLIVIILIILVVVFVGIGIYYFTVNLYPAQAYNVTITSSPSSALVNQTFNVGWSVNGNFTRISNTSIVYGRTHVATPSVGAYPSFSEVLCTTNTTSGCNTPGTFSTQIRMNQTGVYYFRAQAVINGTTYWSNERTIIIEQTVQNQTNQTNQSQNPQTFTVNMQNIAFNPSTLTISQGDTVVWTNSDSVSHTVTSDTGSELSSTILSPGQTFSHTFNTDGTFAYHCTIHPSMIGTIIVN